MDSEILSVSDALRNYVRLKQQFLTTEDGWREFLFYLEARKGVDLHGDRKMDHLNKSINLVDEDRLDRETMEQGEARSAWFEEYGRQPDVLAAFKIFAKNRGLSLSVDQ